ncbi:M23 family metallopeptidase [Streptomyces sp. NPDC003717]|uniref:M23 family metallopeptidase n=1 Tax=Streptomyces sp. NPDC003717 TaxID=3154276 RepID=UPI0033A111E3
MNDRHPSGTLNTPASASDAAPAPYASYDAGEATYGDFTTFDADPLFGTLPGQNTGGYDTTGTYATGAWATVGQAAPYYDAYAAQHHTATHDTGAYDTTAWTAGPGQQQWDTGAWAVPDGGGSGQQWDGTQQWDWGTQTFDTGVWDATQWNPADASQTPAQDEIPPADHLPADHLAATGEMPAVPLLLEEQEELAPPAVVPGARTASRAARRRPAKRSKLMTIAVPSACVMSVAGIAAASVGALSSEDASASAADAPEAQAAPVKPSTANNKLDTQLASLSAGADDFADRASRTQERIDLKAEQAAEKKRAAEEAARKERLRPKFVLPVSQRGLSAYYGQAGVNWMSVHTGIDFPVSYGTSVKAATDGTVRTQYNSAYGNMLILTAKDGTETWYCHLSSYQVASGTSVQAGEPVAFSGNSGNSTGPHLHFEVRPAGGSAIDPLSWLRSHGLDPT